MKTQRTSVTGHFPDQNTVHILKSYVLDLLLGAFAKLCKAINSFIKSVYLSTWNNSVPIERIFMEFDIFQNSVE